MCPSQIYSYIRMGNFNMLTSCNVLNLNKYGQIYMKPSRDVPLIGFYLCFQQMVMRL